MRDVKEMIAVLEGAKEKVSRMAWALSLHVPNGIGGGVYQVEQDQREINGLIDEAIDRIRIDQKSLEQSRQDEKS